MGIIRIGRDRNTNDFIIDNPAVSNCHADLYINDNGTYQFVDHSRNGTLVNHQNVKNLTCTVRDNDVLTFPGNISIRVADIPRIQPSIPCPTKENESVSFSKAWILYFINYANLKGRARRSEFWMVYPFLMIILLIPLVQLAFIIPSATLSVRRLHDVGRSGWSLLLSLIPLVGGIVLLVWYLKDSDKMTNEYGTSTKYPQK